MYSSGLCPQFASLHHCGRGFVQGVPHRFTMQMSSSSLPSPLGELLVKVEKKGLVVNIERIKILVSGMNLDTQRKSGNDPYSVCLTATGTNAFFCGSRLHAVGTQNMQRLSKTPSPRP